MAAQCAERCPICGPSMPNLVYDPATDETICRGCGTVVQAAWHENRQAGPTPNSTPTPRQELGGYMGGLGASIRDVGGRAVHDVGGIRRQQTWHHRTSRSGGRLESARKCKVLIEALADKLSLPSGVWMEAQDISGRACRLGLTRGRSATHVAAAAVLLAIRKANIARSIQDVEGAANISKLAAHYRTLCHMLAEQPPPPGPSLFVSRTVSNLGLPPAVTHAATSMLLGLQGAGLVAGRSPRVLAAAAVFAVATKSGCRVSAKAVSRAAGVSSASIRNVSKILLNGAGRAASQWPPPTV